MVNPKASAVVTPQFCERGTVRGGCCQLVVVSTYAVGLQGLRKLLLLPKQVDLGLCSGARRLLLHKGLGGNA